jgi:predicted amidohydrolase
MANLLPILAVQASSCKPDTDLQDFEDNLLSLLEDFRQTKLVVFPEIHLCGVSGTPTQRAEQLENAAQPMDGPRIKRLSEIARKANVWLLPGTVCERGDDGEIYNTAPVFSPEGELIASYRKCFPWRPHEPYTPGRQFTVFDIPDIGRIGLAICYDIWYPEVVRQLAWMGAEVIINQVQTSTCERAKELILIQANAIFNQVFIVSLNAAIPAGIGQSLIVDPEGNTRTQITSGSEAILTDVLNLEEVSRVRQYGTAGITRPWSQFNKDDLPLDLPIYKGCMDPLTWNPDKKKP